jgi:hypothetical protein
LGGDEDLPDPIGGDEAVYRECAAAIRGHLGRLLDELLGPAPAAGPERPALAAESAAEDV